MCRTRQALIRIVLFLQVPVAHCFGSLGLYKRKFCVVCRKSLEVPSFRCEGTIGPLASLVLSSSVKELVSATPGSLALLYLWFVKGMGGRLRLTLGAPTV